MSSRPIEDPFNILAKLPLTTLVLRSTWASHLAWNLRSWSSLERLELTDMPEDVTHDIFEGVTLPHLTRLTLAQWRATLPLDLHRLALALPHPHALVSVTLAGFTHFIGLKEFLLRHDALRVLELPQCAMVCDELLTEPLLQMR